MGNTINDLFIKAKEASYQINTTEHDQRVKILRKIGAQLLKSKKIILEANLVDLQKYEINHPRYDRLKLTETRIDNIVNDIKNVLLLPDPLNQILLHKKLKNGLNLKKITVPLGLIGIIYEARPNVTIDASILCIKSGNAVILRGGSDSYHTNLVLIKIIQETLAENNLNPNIVTLYPPEREKVHYLLTADEYLDVIIPRGSATLIERTRKEATVPVIQTGAGVVHTYVDDDVDLQVAGQIIFNAKTQRPSVCNALDTVLINQNVLENFLKILAPLLSVKNVEILADQNAKNVLDNIYSTKLLSLAQNSDFGKEYLSLKLSIKTVKSMDEALSHIRKYSSKHTEAILSNNTIHQQRFLKEVDAAVVFVNASTRFTDGGEFELGAEIGISTQKLHARGPMGLDALASYKWIALGQNNIRI